MTLYPFLALVILAILFFISWGLTIWRLGDNKKKYGSYFRRNKNGKIK